jgi:hypothetical protein
MAFKSGLVLSALAGIFLPGIALADAPRIEKINAYLIYEDSGKVSKNIADAPDQIVAQDENGASVQMLVDIVLGGKPGALYENNPVLHVVTKPSLDEAAKPVSEDFYIAFMATDKLFRTIVVNHNCNGFDLEAYVTDGDKRVSEFKKSFSITCGD